MSNSKDIINSGLYYGVTISLVSLATGLSVVTLNLHHRGIRGRRLPKIMKFIVFEILGKLLLMRINHTNYGLGINDGRKRLNYQHSCNDLLKPLQSREAYSQQNCCLCQSLTHFPSKLDSKRFYAYPKVMVIKFTFAVWT